MRTKKETSGRREMVQEEKNTRSYQGRRVEGKIAPPMKEAEPVVNKKARRLARQKPERKSRHGIVWAVLLCVVMLGAAAVYYGLCVYPYRHQGVFNGIDLSEHVTLGDYKALPIHTYTEEGMALKNRVWNDILQGSSLVHCPEEALDAYYADDIAYQEKLARDYGYGTLEEFALAQYGKTLEQFEEYLRGYAEEEVFSDMVTYHIAKEEGLLFTAEEYAQQLQQFLTDKDMTSQEFEQTYGCTVEEYAKEQNLEPRFLKEHIVETLLS